MKFNHCSVYKGTIRSRLYCRSVLGRCTDKYEVRDISQEHLSWGSKLPQSSPHCFVVHIRLIFVKTPQFGDGFGINQFEDSLLPIGPFDVPGAGLPVL